jgi:hypothetical protein
MEAKLLQGINKWTERNKRDKIGNQESVVTLQKKLVTVGYTTRTWVTDAQKFEPLRPKRKWRQGRNKWQLGIPTGRRHTRHGIEREESYGSTEKFISEDDLSMINWQWSLWLSFTYFHT